MSCQLYNNSNADLSSLGPHVQGMYDYFDQKIGFNKPPTIHFDSDPGNQSNVLGKTAYYDPSNLEIHVFTDGRHPKDMLRSIAHELIHHQQNLEGRLDVGGYMGEGYYLKNEAMRELEQEAMLQGNAHMREYEDTIKSEERNKMSLKEWKNNELNGLLLKKFGILKEAKGEKGDANPLDGEREKFDKDLDGVPDGGDKDPNDPEIKEQVTRDEVRADFERMFPKETPEQIEARVADYMDYTPEDSYTRRGVDFGGPGYGEFPPKPEKYGLKQGFKDVMKQAFSMEEEQLQEMGDRREEMFYYFKSKMPDATPEEISAAVDKYMKDTYAPREESIQEEKDDDPRGRAQTGDSPTKKRTGKPDPSGKRFAQQGKGKPYLRKEGLQETLKKLVKAKNITLKSSGKKIK